jgi:Na+-driven multidrug efflux pump
MKGRQEEDKQMQTQVRDVQNPLMTEKIGKLIIHFAVPAIISGLIGSIYNILDQIFIGQSAGIPGNAATNIAFPLVTLCISCALLFGVGGASNFSLALGRGQKDQAMHIMGNALSLLVLASLVIMAVVLTFLRPLLGFFGAEGLVMEYSLTYTGITALGFPLQIFGVGASHLIRADGSPKFAMASMATGAVINIVLDPLFIFTLGWGIAGAAWATVIGQAATAVMMVRYFSRSFKTAPLQREHLLINRVAAKAIASLGAASCINQLAMATVQITMNSSLAYYGDLSVYGRDIPLACVGVITKVNVVFFSIILGISQGTQPILGFNYGARNYGRVKQAYRLAAGYVIGVSAFSWLLFQLFPLQIVSIFGEGTEEYYRFAVRWFRIFMALIFCNGILPLTSNFFTSIGKATRGIILSVTRNLLFLLPMILIFPIYLGIDGIMYAGPITDAVSAVLAFSLVRYEFGKISQLQREQEQSAAPGLQPLPDS